MLLILSESAAHRLGAQGRRNPTFFLSHSREAATDIGRGRSPWEKAGNFTRCSRKLYHVLRGEVCARRPASSGQSQPEGCGYTPRVIRAACEISGLVGKLEIIISEAAVHADDEFAQTGGEGHQGFLASGAPAQIKIFQDALMPNRAQGRQVKRTPHGSSPTADVPHALLSAAVAVARRDAGQGGGGLKAA